MTFKWHDWQPKTDPVDPNKKPMDVCAPVPKDQRFVLLKDRASDLIERRGTEIRKKIQAVNPKFKKNKILFTDIPLVEMVPMGEMMLVLDQQRDAEEDHVIDDIMVPWDSRFFTTPRGAWDPIEKKYAITEGQQRLIALRTRIQMGLFPDIKPNDWEKVKVPIQIVKLEVIDGVVDYGPERRVFNIENGEKLPVSQIDRFKNEVHGKNMDSPNKETYEEFERAAKVYEDMLKAGIVPTGTQGKNANKPGAFKHIAYVRTDNKKGKPKFSRTQLKKIYKRHNAYSLHEPVSAIELKPILLLDDEIENHSWYDKEDPVKVNEAEKFRKNLNATVYNVWHSWEAYMKFAQKLWNRRCIKMGNTKKDETPADWSLTLLIQLTAKAGYTFKGIHKDWYNKYTQPSGWDCLTDEEQALFL